MAIAISSDCGALGMPGSAPSFVSDDGADDYALDEGISLATSVESEIFSRVTAWQSSQVHNAK